MFNPDPSSWLNRVVFGILGLIVIGFGVGALQRVGLSYRNWWGGSVFGLFAILFGVLFIIAMYKLGSAKREEPRRSKHKKEKWSYPGPPWRH